MPIVRDGPDSPLFTPLTVNGNLRLRQLARAGVSPAMVENLKGAPEGRCTSWGIPFKIGKVVLLRDKQALVKFRPVKASWLVFDHTSDIRPLEWNRDGFLTCPRGRAHAGEHAADYVILYADGTEQRQGIRRGYEIGIFSRRWGECPMCAVSDAKPHSLPAESAATIPNREWGRMQTRANSNDIRPWVNWLWAWRNPRPDKAVVGVRFEPVSGIVVVSAVSAGDVDEMPLRWETRRKAILTLPRGQTFDVLLKDSGLYAQVQLDLGQVISAQPRRVYPDRNWAKTYNNCLPEVSPRQVLIEYTAHPEARFHFPKGKSIPVGRVSVAGKVGPIQAVAPASQPVTLRVVEKPTGKPVAVKLHVHGQAGEYLAPVDRHRIPNFDWFQDYAPEFAHRGVHFCTYIDGTARMDLPPGRVYVEVSKGFEIRPVRQVLTVTPATRDIVIELEKVLPWRSKGWVSADTHVHFLSPPTALLEGAGEGVNIVNLLASQWGELMTNAGDFDGRTTFGARQAGGDGEYLVRVGTENRQHVLGHISLLGYNGPIIAPMTTGGPDEAAIGDPVGCLLMEWARQCRLQDGVVVLPHHPNPRAEAAAALVSSLIDGVEMTSWGDLYGGIDPYSLSDWYRYLNCGYMTAAVGGTDKMSAATAVGTVRTYARIPPEQEFTYDAWKQAVRLGNTFVTYGPLMEFAVEGASPGARLSVNATGATVDATWNVASVTVPMSRVELVVNGEIRASQPVRPDKASGHWSVKLDRSSWLALLVRGHYHDRPEIIAAHSSPVLVTVKGAPVIAAADSLTILEQIEGSLAFLDTIATRAESAAFKRMKLALTAARRDHHNRMHQAGVFHQHAPGEDHPEHH